MFLRLMRPVSGYRTASERPLKHRRQLLPLLFRFSVPLIAHPPCRTKFVALKILSSELLNYFETNLSRSFSCDHIYEINIHRTTIEELARKEVSLCNLCV